MMVQKKYDKDSQSIKYVIALLKSYKFFTNNTTKCLLFHFSWGKVVLSKCSMEGGVAIV